MEHPAAVAQPVHFELVTASGGPRLPIMDRSPESSSHNALWLFTEPIPKQV